MKSLKDLKLCIIGMGYVGLPLAVEFGKIRSVWGFDTNHERIRRLIKGEDTTFEITGQELKLATKLKLTSNFEEIKDVNCFIITVPTPIDKNKKPDLTYILHASKMVGEVLTKGDLVIFESTVFPGATEEECVPVIEQASGLTFNKHFFVGYSPERINPGDKKHSLISVKKVTSGSTAATAKLVDELYQEIIKAGTHLAGSIKIAEAAKVIENVQRDLNIALVNELSIIFQKLGIESEEVFKAAESKWNFMPFRPGLVGGHCIGIDPYYLTFKAETIGYTPKVILAGREMNDGMGELVAQNLIKAMQNSKTILQDAKILIMGATFKENCPDIRNAKIKDTILELKAYKIVVEIFDPWVSNEEIMREYNCNPVTQPQKNHYDAIIIAVAHNEFKAMGVRNIRSFGKSKHFLYDLKYVFKSSETDMRL